MFGRYIPSSTSASGTYGAELGADSSELAAVRRAVEGFERREGRRPRILIAKMGMDGHDRGAKVMATG